MLPLQDILIGAGKLVDNHTVKYSLPGQPRRWVLVVHWQSTMPC